MHVVIGRDQVHAIYLLASYPPRTLRSSQKRHIIKLVNYCAIFIKVATPCIQTSRKIIYSYQAQFNEWYTFPENMSRNLAGLSQFNPLQLPQSPISTTYITRNKSIEIVIF